MKDMWLKKGLVVTVILLFVGVAFAPSITANMPIPDDVTSGTRASNFTADLGTLSGYVTNSVMNPIEGARVRVYFHNTSRENYSDANGYFHVTDIPICNCTKNATCSKEGYNPVWVYLTIWENTTYDFVLTPYNMTELAITSISPFTIKNVGNATALNVRWSIIVKGGFILLGRNSFGELLQPLPPDQEIVVKSRFFLLGLGAIEITYSAWADNAPVVSAKINGILLLFFFRIIGK
jgi:hypothetical protein